MNMQAFFSQASEPADQHSEPQGQNFTDHSSPYTNAQYGYVPIATNYPIDHNLVVHNDHTVPSNASSIVQNQAGTIVSTSRDLAASPTAHVRDVPDDVQAEISKHKSNEDGDNDVSAGQKRKRSKVSRACDQCRKKKIRCDAEAAEDGALKTCNNCQTRGQICEFSRIPQKRGPSKGYIKELSERVQHVEGQLALQGTSGFRASLDGSGPFGDATFSPEDELAYRRQSSLSQYKSPFAGISRDRMPSIGGWHTSTTHIPIERSRFSIAIPPDQQLPVEAHSKYKVVKPSWLSWFETPIRRTERRQYSTPPQHAILYDVPEQRAVFEQYRDTIQKDISLLPDTFEALEDIIKHAPPELRMVLISIMKLLSGEYAVPDGKTERPSEIDLGELRDTVELVLLGQWHPVDDYMGADALTLLWCLLLYPILASHYFELRLRVPSYDCAQAIETAIRLCTNAFQKRLDIGSGALDVYWYRAVHVMAILARLEALSQGLEDEPLPVILIKRLHDTDAQLSTAPDIRFQALSMEACQACLSLIDEQGIVSRPSLTRLARMQGSCIRAWQILCELDDDTPVVQQVKQFFDLLCLRVSNFHATRSAVEPTLMMVTVLETTLTPKADQQVKLRCNPLTRHLYTLATFTLMELLQSDLVSTDPETFNQVRGALDTVQASLTSWSRYRARLPDSAPAQPSTSVMYWADSLMTLIARHGEEYKIGALSEKDEGQTTSSLVALLQQGYMKVCNNFMLRKA